MTQQKLLSIIEEKGYIAVESVLKGLIYVVSNDGASKIALASVSNGIFTCDIDCIPQIIEELQGISEVFGK